MKAIIIEDEQQAVTALKQELKVNCPEIEIIGQASKIKEAAKLILQSQPDIVFLDIQLKDGTGFEVLEIIGNYNFKVIFTTAYSKYAIQAIKISALDYLLKPIDSDQLIQAVQKAKMQDLSNVKSQIESIVQNQDLNPLRKKIALPTSKGISLYEVINIIRIQSEGNYSGIYLTNGKRLVAAKTLKEFEEMLLNNGFLRIHHSHIINLHHLQSYMNKDGGYVILTNKETFPVSKRKKADLLKVLNMSNKQIV